MESLFDQLGRLEALVSNMVASGQFGELSDSELQRALKGIASGRHQFDLLASMASGEIAHRSRRDLGYTGLAQAAGYTNPQKLVQRLTGTTRTEAARLVNVGTMILDSRSLDLADAGSVEGGSVGGQTPSGDDQSYSTVPWFAVISDAVTAQALNPGQADALRNGLGEPSELVDQRRLRAAAIELLPLLAELTPERIWKTARQARDLLDPTGLAERRQQQRARRTLKAWRDREGMVHLTAVFDPEDGDEVLGAINHALRPRIGGVRFVDAASKAADEQLLADPRSNEQIAADTLVTLIRTAVDADHATLGRARPAVRVVIPAPELSKSNGIGFLDESAVAVPRTTIDRIACDGGFLPVVLSPDGTPLDVGRTQRLFTPRQRTYLTIRDAGCRWPGCDKPPSFCEAHHINHWHQDQGQTNCNDGILLCRHHHMLLQDNHWKIRRQPAADRTTVRSSQRHATDTGNVSSKPAAQTMAAQTMAAHEFLLIPPRSVDPAQRPRRMPDNAPLTKYWNLRRPARAMGAAS